MASERALELIDDVQRRLDELAAELEALGDAGGGARSARRAGAAAERSGTARLPAVILPTRTDDPESIVGGRPTADFPDCCAVGDASDYYCTGTLVAPTLVVTAKHCDGASRVFLKGSDIRVPSEGETVRVTEVIPHPDRNVDLEVLVLRRRSRVKPRHIAQGREIPPLSPSLRALLVGFGTIDLGGRVGYGQKRRVEVPITSLDCQPRATATRHGCRGGFEMVAGQRGLNRDSCKGDSGGPLYIQSRSTGEYFLLGATSRGVREGTNVCGDGGIYVRVDKFVDWIREATGVEIPGPLA